MIANYHAIGAAFAGGAAVGSLVTVYFTNKKHKKELAEIQETVNHIVASYNQKKEKAPVKKDISKPEKSPEVKIEETRTAEPVDYHSITPASQQVTEDLSIGINSHFVVDETVIATINPADITSLSWYDDGYLIDEDNKEAVDEDEVVHLLGTPDIGEVILRAQREKLDVNDEIWIKNEERDRYIAICLQYRPYPQDE